VLSPAYKQTFLLALVIFSHLNLGVDSGHLLPFFRTNENGLVALGFEFVLDSLACLQWFFVDIFGMDPDDLYVLSLSLGSIVGEPNPLPMFSGIDYVNHASAIIHRRRWCVWELEWCLLPSGARSTGLTPSVMMKCRWVLRVDILLAEYNGAKSVVKLGFVGLETGVEDPGVYALVESLLALDYLDLGVGENNGEESEELFS
jgi:hypothetical protein